DSYEVAESTASTTTTDTASGGTGVKMGRSSPKNNYIYRSMPPRQAIHRPYRPPMRPVRQNMNDAQPKRTYFYKPTHSYNKRPFQESTQNFEAILIQRVKMLERELKARTPIYKVERGRSRRRKGKEVMVESKSPKEQKVQEQIDAQEEAERLKRKGLNLEQEHVKKQKTSEEAPEIEKSTEEIFEEKMKEMMQLVPIEYVYVQSLQVKHPIIDWKVHTERQRSYWKIIRSAKTQFRRVFVVSQDTTSRETNKKSGRTVTLTAEDMQKRKNDVKERTTLLLSLPDEHQLRFSKYKTAQELWAAILETFGGNEATTKTKKNLLKQQYGNFKAEGSETLDQTFNKLQVIVGQLLTPLVETVDRIFFLVRQGVKMGRSSPKNNYTHRSMPPRPAIHRPYRPPMRPVRPNMNDAQPKRTSFYKPAHSYNKRPFQKSTQNLVAILIQRVKMLERELKARTPIHKTQQRKPWSKKQKRDYYMTVIRSNLGWKEEAERLKKKGLSLEQVSVKKLKTSKEVSEEAKSPDEVPKKKVKEMMQLVPIEEVFVKALQVKHPIINWKNFMHSPVEWKLYDMYGVHQVTSKDKEIFMLLEKDYPLRKGLALVMIWNKMHKAFPLLVIEFPMVEEVPTVSEESSYCQKKRDATAKRIALVGKCLMITPRF
nr:hypothetical protein [Tanacetum cinerariifolium]